MTRVSVSVWSDEHLWTMALTDLKRYLPKKTKLGALNEDKGQIRRIASKIAVYSLLQLLASS